MHDKEPPPPWTLVLLAMGMGLIAQLGASLALDMARDVRKLIGFLLLSAVFSSTATVLLAELTSWDDYVCAAIGTLVGACPALWTLRAGVKAMGQKYGVDVSDLINAPAPTPPAPPKEGGKDAH